MKKAVNAVHLNKSAIRHNLLHFARHHFIDKNTVPKVILGCHFNLLLQKFGACHDVFFLVVNLGYNHLNLLADKTFKVPNILHRRVTRWHKHAVIAHFGVKPRVIDACHNKSKLTAKAERFGVLVGDFQI